jgi:membrane protein DedA with SNARE-associated domain
MEPSAPLPGLLGDLAPLLDDYGYLAIAALVGVEGFGIPAPGQTILVAASLYAGAGHLSIPIVAVVALLATVVGDNIGYAIGRLAGRPAILRYGRYIWLTARRFDRVESFTARHGPRIITVARFIEGLRQLNGIVAGATGIRWRRFFVFDALGAVLWVGTWASLGYLAGDFLVAIYDDLADYQWYALAVPVLVGGALVARRVIRRRRSRPR